MFSFFRKKVNAKPARSSVFAYAKLNSRTMPIDRGDRFEDPLQGELEKSGCAEVTGGGTMQDPETGEISFCGIDLDMFDVQTAVPLICSTLTRLGAPKGSALEYKVDGNDVVVEFGAFEGLAVYLNGTDLPKEVYQQSDVNVVIEEINKAIDGRGAAVDFWEGPRETALYLYGISADEMRRLIEPFMASYPLCQRARVERIA